MSNEPPINYCWEDFVQNESRDSYYALYRHYYSYLCYIGLKKKYGTEAVKDTINDVFLYIWEKRKSLQHVHHPHNYILTFFYRSLFKKNRLSEIPLSNLAENGDASFENFSEPSCEQELLSRETRERLSSLLTRYLNQLPRKQREIIYQKFYLGLSYTEIASANKLSVNTVYNTVYSTVRKLRSAIPSKTLASLISLCIAVLLIFF